MGGILLGRPHGLPTVIGAAVAVDGGGVGLGIESQLRGGGAGVAADEILPVPLNVLGDLDALLRRVLVDAHNGPPISAGADGHIHGAAGLDVEAGAGIVIAADHQPRTADGGRAGRVDDRAVRVQHDINAADGGVGLVPLAGANDIDLTGVRLITVASAVIADGPVRGGPALGRRHEDHTAGGEDSGAGGTGLNCGIAVDGHNAHHGARATSIDAAGILLGGDVHRAVFHIHIDVAIRYGNGVVSAGTRNIHITVAVNFQVAGNGNGAALVVPQPQDSVFGAIRPVGAEFVAGTITQIDALAGSARGDGQRQGAQQHQHQIQCQKPQLRFRSLLHFRSSSLQFGKLISLSHRASNIQKSKITPLALTVKQICTR